MDKQPRHSGRILKKSLKRVLSWSDRASEADIFLSEIHAVAGFRHSARQLLNRP